MSNLSLERLLFDPSAPADGPNIGSYLIGSGGTVISETGTALDVNIDGATGLAIFAEDAAAAGGADGQSVLMVRQDTLATDTSTDGDYSWFKGNAKGELYVIDSDGNALLTTIDADTGAILTDTNAMVVDLAAIEVLITAGNVDLAAMEVLLTSIDADTSSIAVDTAAMVVDLAAIEALLITIDADTSSIAVDTAAMVVDLAAIEVLLTSIDADTSTIAGDTTSIDALLTAAVDALGRVTVNDSPNNAIEDTAVSVLATATALPQLANRTRMFIQNNGDKSIFVGKAAVTTANGLEVSKGGTLILEAGPALAFFAISASGTQDVRVLELS